MAREASDLPAGGSPDAAAGARASFLANLSHGLRTPLQGILGMAELLAGTPLSPEQSRHLAVLTRQALALEGLVAHVLDYLRLAALLGGRLDVQSAEGGGGTFSLILPAGAEPPPPGETPPALLVVADVQERGRLERLLRDGGHPVVAAADGRSALTELVGGVVRGAPYGLVVLARDLEDMAAGDWLRRMESGPWRCPAVVVGGAG
jgi:hypothetical protein